MKKFFSFLTAAAMLFAASCSSSDDLDDEDGDGTETETVDTLKVQPANEIWYTSSDSSIVTPYKTDVFGANIVSNTYENGKGVIKFNSSVTSIGDYAFEGCSSLTSITIPNNVTNIGANPFYGCEDLSSIYGKFAIADNKALVVNAKLIAFAIGCGDTLYTIPEGITSIGEVAFAGCSSLTSVTIPNSVTNIGEAAFVSCSSLTSVTIPNSMTSIDDAAFDYCSSLEYIYCSAIFVPVLGRSPFNRHFVKVIYVPMESVETYKNADGWKDYANKIEGYNFN